MPFQKGNKYGKGGARLGAGEPSAEKKRIRKAAAEMAREYIEKHLKPVLEAYKELAGGRPVRHYNQQTGELLYTEKEVDAPTLRHWVDRLLPPAKQEISVEVTTADDLFVKLTERKHGSASSED